MAPDGFQLYGEDQGDRIDALTLPQARNYRLCPKCQGFRCVRVSYCPTCRTILTWDERSAEPHAIVPMRD